MENNLKKTVCLAGLALTFAATTDAASQLAPFYQALANDSRAVDPIDVDLSKVKPSEELPAMIAAVNSGNRAVMDAAVRNAISIVQIHKMDWESPHMKRLKPSFPEVAGEFRPLASTLAAHFSDSDPEVSSAPPRDDFRNTPWKTQIVQFLDVLRETPTPEMVAWMLKVVQWPKSEVDAMHDSFLRGTMEHYRSYALKIAPVLAHLQPMPQAVVDTLISRIDDSSEPLVAANIIWGLTDNKAPATEIVDRLVPKALDPYAAIKVRVAAIYAVAKLRPSDRSRLLVLRGIANEEIAMALGDVGVR